MTIFAILRTIVGSCVLLGAIAFRFYGQQYGWPGWISIPLFIGMLLVAISLLSWQKNEKRPPESP